jgi:mannose-1-phosphate guanylyltransferase
MVMVARKPFLEHVIDSFSTRGFKEFVFLVGHHSDVIESHFGRARGELRFEYSREKELLGTGGAVRDAAHLLGDRFILTYGDVLRRFDYDRFVEDHSGSCLAIYPFRPGLTTINAGNVAVDEHAGLVTRFAKGAPELKLPYVDAGFSVVDATALESLPSTGVCSFEAAVFPALAARGELEFELVNRDFYDIGNPADLAATRSALEAEL